MVVAGFLACWGFLYIGWLVLLGIDRALALLAEASIPELCGCFGILLLLAFLWCISCTLGLERIRGLSLPACAPWILLKPVCRGGATILLESWGSLTKLWLFMPVAIFGLLVVYSQFTALILVRFDVLLTGGFFQSALVDVDDSLWFTSDKGIF
ncbi:hypothetical protein Ancab_002390 [Ancistrocladus abbreviatus]